jgi:hypothetical protein
LDLSLQATAYRLGIFLSPEVMEERVRVGLTPAPLSEKEDQALSAAASDAARHRLSSIPDCVLETLGLDRANAAVPEPLDLD